MGKKRGKQRDPVHKDAHHRMNFLFQAAHTVLAANPNNIELARFYMTTMNSVSQKLVLKLDPQVKRLMCKYCQALLVPGITSRVRTQSKRETHTVVTCLDCGRKKRFLARKNFMLWSERQEQGEMEQTPKGEDSEHQSIHQQPEEQETQE